MTVAGVNRLPFVTSQYSRRPPPRDALLNSCGYACPSSNFFDGFPRAFYPGVKLATRNRAGAITLAALLNLWLSSIYAQQAAGAAPGKWRNSPYLLGDWASERTRLENA